MGYSYFAGHQANQEYHVTWVLFACQMYQYLLFVEAQGKQG